MVEDVPHCWAFHWITLRAPDDEFVHVMEAGGGTESECCVTIINNIIRRECNMRLLKECYESAIHMYFALSVQPQLRNHVPTVATRLLAPPITGTHRNQK